MVQRPATGLRNIAMFARASVPFYAALMPAEPPLDFRAFDQWFERLPILTRSDLKANRARLFSANGEQTGWQRVRTSGSTGEPVEVVLDSMSRATDAAVLAGFIDRRLGSEQWRTGLFLHLVIHPGAMSRRHPAEWHPQGEMAKWNLVHAWQLPVPDFIHVLRQLGGRVIATLPSVAQLIAQRLTGAARTHAMVPRLLLLSGEAVTETERQGIQSAFECPVAGAFTLAEIGIIGIECENSGSFHVAVENAHVEIVAVDGGPAVKGEIGDLVVTGLANRAMPLIRYRTGDRARWAGEPCRCGDESPRFVPGHSRQPTYLRDSAGRSINVIRFGKLMAGLGFRKYTFQQNATGEIAVSYDAVQPVSNAVRNVVESSIRTAVGPFATVSWKRLEAGSSRPGGQLPASVRESNSRLTEPLAAGLDELIPWLRLNLEQHPGIDVALVTGSALEPLARTRYSDVDVVVLGRENAPPPVWSTLAQRLRCGHTGINLMADQLGGLERRAPLFAIRLLCEQRLIIGSLDEAVLPWPPIKDLFAEARFWAQNARVEFVHRMINPPSQPSNPVFEAWRTAKKTLQALRFLQVLEGSRDTRFLSVLHNASGDRRFGAAWFTDFVWLLDVARERVPPPSSNGVVDEELGAVVIHALNILSHAVPLEGC